MSFAAVVARRAAVAPAGEQPKRQGQRVALFQLVVVSYLIVQFCQAQAACLLPLAATTRMEWVQAVQSLALP